MNIYTKYQFHYNKKNSFNSIKAVLKKNGIISFDDFINFTVKYDDTLSYDTLYAYYSGKRSMPFPVINMIHTAFNVTLQKLILPNSSCLFDGVINNESLVYNEFNNYRDFYYSFKFYNNVLTQYEQKYSEPLTLKDLASDKVENMLIKDITAFAKRLSRLIYLIQKNNQSILSNYEKREIDSGMFYIYSHKIGDEFLDRIKEYPNEELYYSLYNEYPLSFLNADNFDFLTLFFYGNQNIVNRITAFLTPIERDILLTLIYNLNDSNSVKLKNTLLNDGAKKLKGIADAEVIESFDFDCLETLIVKITKIKEKIKKLSYSEYEELREACNE